MLGGLSKRGNKYVRTLFIIGARADSTGSISSLLAGRPPQPDAPPLEGSSSDLAQADAECRLRMAFSRSRNLALQIAPVRQQKLGPIAAFRLDMGLPEPPGRMIWAMPSASALSVCCAAPTSRRARARYAAR